MAAPAYMLAAIKELEPCAGPFEAAEALLPARHKITVAMAIEAGVPFEDVVWALSALSQDTPDIERRLRLWLADCAAHVLHTYEKTGNSTAPRQAIIAARQFARGEIDDATRAVVKAAVRAVARTASEAAARDAAWAAARAAARAAASDAAWAAARGAAWASARASAWAAAGDPTRNAARDAASYAEEEWQTERLIAWFSDVEPEDWPLPDTKPLAEAAE